MARMQVIGAALALATLAACGGEAVRSAVTAPTMIPDAKPGLGGRVLAALPGGRKTAPAMEWTSQDGSDEWTRATLAALESEGVTLLSTIPSDVIQYCPSYAKQNRENRANFWAGFLSSVAKQQSGLNPAAKGGQDSMGLMLITPAAAVVHGCGGSMLDGSSNMACAVRILAKSVVADGAIHGGDDQQAEPKRGWRGVARDWMPLRSKAKRAEIANFTKKQSYCQ